MEILSKKKTTKSEARKVVKALKTTLASLVDVAASVCDRSAQVVAPIVGSKYVRSREDTNMVLCTNIECTMYGCYLFFNVNIGAYVWSGVAASKDGFGDRLPQHDQKGEVGS